MLRQLAINFLFSLLGHRKTQLHSLAVLFDKNATAHATRQKRWEHALMRLWLDKDMLDFLYYHAESDKEIVFKGKTNADLSKGARIRTLFIVYSAHTAHKTALQNKKKLSPTEMDSRKRKTKMVEQVYKKLVDIGS